jgi:chromosome segregation ATPase
MKQPPKWKVLDEEIMTTINRLTKERNEWKQKAEQLQTDKVIFDRLDENRSMNIKNLNFQIKTLLTHIQTLETRLEEKNHDPD